MDLDVIDDVTSATNMAKILKPKVEALEARLKAQDEINKCR